MPINPYPDFPKLPGGESDILYITRYYRMLVDGYETTVAEAIGNAWLQVARGLSDDFMRLQNHIQIMRANGAIITENYINKLDYYSLMMQQVKEQIARFNGITEAQLVRLQQGAATLALQQTGDVLTATLSPTTFWERINTDAVEQIFGVTQNGTPFRALLDRDYPATATAISEAMMTSIARGGGVQNMAEMMMDAARNMALQRALLIARTESARAYREATLAQYRASKSVTGFWRLVKKETACIACLMLDGEYYELMAEFTDHPRGKCDIIPAIKGTKKPNWQTGYEYFMDLPENEKIERMGQGMYALWKHEGFDLHDLAEFRGGDVWGKQPYTVSLKEMLSRYGMDKVPKEWRNEVQEIMERAKPKPVPVAPPPPLPKPLPVPPPTTQQYDPSGIDPANGQPYRDQNGNFIDTGNYPDFTNQPTQYMERYMQDVFGLETRYDSMDRELAESVNAALYEFGHRYPAVMANHLNGVGSKDDVASMMYARLLAIYQNDPRTQGYPLSVLQAEALKEAKKIQRQMGSALGNAITANANTVSSSLVAYGDYTKQELIRLITEGATTGFHPAGAITEGQTIWHELGHVLDYAVEVFRDPDVRRSFLINDITTLVSGYADTDLHEYIAEAFSEYMDSPTPRSEAVFIFDKINQLYIKKYGTP